MGFSDAAALLATALTAVTAGAGWILRRWGDGAFALRMRPHLVLGYAVLGLALLHGILSASNAEGANGIGIACAVVAVAGLGLQTFSGTNLQSPGAYRLVLRRWHTTLFWSIAVLLLAHVLLNA